MAVVYEPIKLVGTIDGQGPGLMSRQLEDAAQTYNNGVPVILVSGYVREATFLAPQVVYGISQEKGHNLSSAGVPKTTFEDTPPNQPNARILPVGAWPSDGMQGYYRADGKNIFSIMLKDGQVFTQAMLAPGTLFGLTKDGSSGYWYLDNTDTSGDNAVAKVLRLDTLSPNTAALGARVFFQFDATKRFF